MPKDRLSDAACRNAKPKNASYKLADGGGLFLLVTASTESNPKGSKLWRYRYRIGDKENVYAIGAYPGIGLERARKERERARELVRQGIHPKLRRDDEYARNVAETEERARKTDSAFERIAREWLEQNPKGYVAGTLRAKRARLERHVFPKLGARPVAEITAAEVADVLDLIQNAGAWAAIHTKGDVVGVLRYAARKRLLDRNVARDVEIDSAPASESKRVLLPAELRTLIRTLPGMRALPETPLALHLIALTACRVGELCVAEWVDFDLQAGVWRRPAAKMKGRVEHVMPLSAQAVRVVNALHAITGAGRWVLPHRDKPGHSSHPARLRYAMRQVGLDAGASPHALRTTFSTWANERAFRPDAIERQLAHVEKDRIRATYNKSLLMDERRAMMQRWADYLDALEAGAEVIPLRVQAA